MLKLEVGKSYLNGMNEIVKIIKKDTHSKYPFDGDCVGSYTINGKCNLIDDGPYDLVSEYNPRPTELKLEVGKSYVNKNGNIIEIVSKYEPIRYYGYRGSNNIDYTENGLVIEPWPSRPSGYVLVSEYISEDKKVVITEVVPRKNSELIKAWADGAKIQKLGLLSANGCYGWQDCDYPDWSSDIQFRVKPPKRANYHLYMSSANVNSTNWERLPTKSHNVRGFFDGDTDKLISIEMFS